MASDVWQDSSRAIDVLNLRLTLALRDQLAMCDRTAEDARENYYILYLIREIKRLERE